MIEFVVILILLFGAFLWRVGRDYRDHPEWFDETKGRTRDQSL